MSYLWRDIAPLVSTLASRPMGRRRLLAGLALSTALAAAGPIGPIGRARAQAASATPDGAKQFVQNVAGQAISIMADKSQPDAQRADRFKTLFDASFDLPVIGQIVLGRHWQSISDQQRQQFLILFEQQQVLTWADRFKSYSGQSLSVQSATPDENASGRMRVSSQIQQTSGAPIELDWQIVNAKDGWRIVDLAVSNASLALTLRQDFDAVLTSNGGKFDSLLAAMQKKIDQLKSPA